MPAGGKREGAGRKSGIPNKASLARQKRVAASGATPLDVMLKDMRYHDALADKEAKKGVKADVAKVAKERLAAREAAEKAAPYVHPKLQSVVHGSNPDQPVKAEIKHSLDEKSAQLIANLVK